MLELVSEPKGYDLMIEGKRALTVLAHPEAPQTDVALWLLQMSVTLATSAGIDPDVLQDMLSEAFSANMTEGGETATATNVLPFKRRT